MDILTKLHIGMAVFLYAIPQILVFINRKSFFIYSFTILIMLVVVWGQHFYVSSGPLYDGGPGEFLGILLGIFITVGYVAGFFVCCCVAALHKLISKLVAFFKTGRYT